MDRTCLIDEVIKSAFKLAYFIHGDKQKALSIATAALAKQEIAVAAQDKRLYYRLGAQSSKGAKHDHFRTKVYLSELHLLQRLVYIESEPYERLHEQSSEAPRLNEEDMIIRFVKHLVRITTRRNSFYVALGVSRILHNYSTAKTMDIYNVVVQDPDRVKEDYYYRSRKGRLMQEMKERFGGFISTLKGPRGEERFQTEVSQQCYTNLVRKCMRLFTPWGTPCLVPAGFNSFDDPINRFAFQGNDPDEEHEIEVDRFHALLHPDCYQRLIEALRFDKPETCLEIPRFNLAEANDDEGSHGSRDDFIELDDEDVVAISNALAEQAARRKTTAAGLLRIIVDSKERGLLDLNRTDHVQFEVDESDELIEIRTEKRRGDILLATYLLTHDEISPEACSWKTSITLEGGQKITFMFSSRGDLDGAAFRTSVEVTYRETNPGRAMAMFLRRRKADLLDSAGLKGGRVFRLPKPIFVFTLLFLSCAIALAYILTAKQRELTIAQEHAKQATAETSFPSEEPPDSEAKDLSLKPPSSALPEGSGPSPKHSSPPANRIRQTTRSAPDTNLARARAIITADPRPETRWGSEVEATRGLRIQPTVSSLLEVKKIYIESKGDETLSQDMRDLLVNDLQMSNKLTVTQSPHEADAALKLSVSRRRGAGDSTVKQGAGRDTKGENIKAEIAYVTAQVVNADGVTLWPNGSGRSYAGVPAEVSSKVVKDLLADLERLRSKLP